MVTGAALIVQGLAQATLGHRFSPLELRQLLVIEGTPSANPAIDRIGVMPNLRALITNSRLNLAPDIYLRDYIGDTGQPTAGTVSQSPDIIVRQSPVADPQAAFGQGSGTENNVSLSDDVRAGSDHHIYVRVLNRGGSAAASVSVDVYWSPPATLVTPNMWTLIGTGSLPPVPTGNVLTVANEITWSSTSLPAPGHYCFVAVAGNPADPKPNPTTFGSFDQYVSYNENNNNVAWRNFNVIMGPPPGSPPGFYQLDFFIPGAFDTSRRFGFEAIGRLPEGSRAMLEVPSWFAETLRARPTSAGNGQASNGMTRLGLHPHGVLALGTAVLQAKSVAHCRLLIEIPDKVRQLGDYDFAVRQLYGATVVGRLTWRFAATKNGGMRNTRGIGN